MMRKIFSIFTTAIILGFSVMFGALASTVNSHEAAVGDTVEYEIHAIGCPTKIRALDISVYYDSTSLSYVDGSLETPALDTAVTNADLLGEIRFNAITLDGFSFEDDGVLLRAKFEVIDDLDPEISLYFTVKKFIDENKSDLRDTYTVDITKVDSAKQFSEIEQTSSGEPAADSDITFVVSDTSDSDVVSPADTESSQGDISTASNISTIQEQDIPSDKAIVLDTADNPVNTKKHNPYYLPIFLCGVGIVILIGILLVILKSDSGKGSHYSK